jgi:hypothetical protein
MEVQAAIMPLSKQEITMSKSERERTPEALADEQLEKVSGGEFIPQVPLVISAPVEGGVGEIPDPAMRCGTHPGVIRR